MSKTTQQTYQPESIAYLARKLELNVSWWQSPVQLTTHYGIDATLSAAFVSWVYHYADMAKVYTTFSSRQRDMRYFRHDWRRSLLEASMSQTTSAKMIRKTLPDLGLRPANHCGALFAPGLWKLVNWQVLLHPFYLMPLIPMARGLELLQLHIISLCQHKATTLATLTKAAVSIAWWLLLLPLRILGLPVTIANKVTMPLREQTIVANQQEFKLQLLEKLVQNQRVDTQVATRTRRSSSQTERHTTQKQMNKLEQKIALAEDSIDGSQRRTIVAVATLPILLLGFSYVLYRECSSQFMLLPTEPLTPLATLMLHQSYLAPISAATLSFACNVMITSIATLASASILAGLLRVLITPHCNMKKVLRGDSSHHSKHLFKAVHTPARPRGLSGVAGGIGQQSLVTLTEGELQKQAEACRQRRRQESRCHWFSRRVEQRGIEAWKDNVLHQNLTKGSSQV